MTNSTNNLTLFFTINEFSSVIKNNHNSLEWIETNHDDGKYLTKNDMILWMPQTGRYHGTLKRSAFKLRIEFDRSSKNSIRVLRLYLPIFGVIQEYTVERFLNLLEQNKINLDWREDEWDLWFCSL
ncbi:MAG: hypothetical protein WC284_18055 [Candidimonas sp.]